jgi:hypothetical protein
VAKLGFGLREGKAGWGMARWGGDPDGAGWDPTMWGAVTPQHRFTDDAVELVMGSRVVSVLGSFA